MDKIGFFRGEYFFLSNFYEAPIVYDGIRYENNEAAFQAQKVKPEPGKKDDPRLEFSRLTPSEARRAGRKVILRKDWEDVKVSIMEEIVLTKFEQNDGLKEKLLSTGDAYLEEGNNWGDRVWGVVNGQGANNLGKILMKVRDKLREKEKYEVEDNNFDKIMSDKDDR